MVQGESQAQQQLIDSLREAFADRQVAGLLFGKVQRARELGLKMIIVPDVYKRQMLQRVVNHAAGCVFFTQCHGVFEVKHQGISRVDE